ncbi:MAG: DUF4375 domain-containing protein [Candidatus Kapabacteria bacterium]|nr:DUF4375 domain-containing protein [Candidatus Kapabacteria bacterium]
METPLPDQLPTALWEIAVLNLYLGSVVLVIGLIVVAIVIRKNGRFVLSKFFMISTLLIVISIPVSLFVWRIWDLEIDIMFGPIHLPTLIAILIIEPLLIKLFGFSFIFEKNTDQFPSDKEIEESIQSFIEIPSYRKLTEDIIQKTADDDLGQLVFNNIEILMEDDPREEFDIVNSLSKGQQMIYSTFWVEAEVYNGGFNQFYFNPSGVFAEMAVYGFKIIGADDLSDLMEKANTIFIENRDLLEAFNDGTAESFIESYKDNPLNDLDHIFNDLDEQIDIKVLKAKYIRENIDEFIQ